MEGNNSVICVYSRYSGSIQKQEIMMIVGLVIKL